MYVLEVGAAPASSVMVPPGTICVNPIGVDLQGWRVINRSRYRNVTVFTSQVNL